MTTAQKVVVAVVVWEVASWLIPAPQAAQPPIVHVSTTFQDTLDYEPIEPDEPATPSPQWLPWTGHPGYEVWGLYDERGVFRYTHYRLMAGYTVAPQLQAGGNCAGGVCR